jgi:hypothetical protein
MESHQQHISGPWPPCRGLPISQAPLIDNRRLICVLAKMAVYALQPDRNIVAGHGIKNPASTGKIDAGSTLSAGKRSNEDLATDGTRTPDASK